MPLTGIEKSTKSLRIARSLGIGTVFRYIADAVVAERGQCKRCQVCGTEDARVFDAFGTTLGSDGPSDEVEIVCAKCLHAERLLHEDEQVVKNAVEKWIGQHCADEDRPTKKQIRKHLWSAFRQTPCMPRQNMNIDWPICCRDLAEYLGEPDDGDACLAFCREAIFWSWGDTSKLDDHAQIDLNPGIDLFEFQHFQCLHCDSKFWTHITTRPPWAFAPFRTLDASRRKPC